MSLILSLLSSPVFTKLLNLIPDPAVRAAQLQALITELAASDQQQTQINQTEAASSNLFVAGWRPAIGWTCAFALFYQYIVIPFATWGFAAAKVPIPPLPTLDENLWQLTTGMLGLGVMRGIEKIKGVTK